MLILSEKQTMKTKQKIKAEEMRKQKKLGVEASGAKSGFEFCHSSLTRVLTQHATTSLPQAPS